MTYFLATDGGCLGNGTPTAIGSWAFWLKCSEPHPLLGCLEIKRSGRKVTFGGVPPTNNRMEYLAAICGLSVTPEGSTVELVTDSMNLCNCIGSINGGYVNKKSTMDPILVAELTDLLKRRTVTATWIKGHAGHLENSWCDLACQKHLV